MKLQLAIDLMPLDDIKTMLQDIVDFVDIVEIGPSLIMTHGISIVTEIKQLYPHVTVLADLKITESGKYLANIGFEAGADIITVLDVTDDETIEDILTLAVRYDKAVMIDLMAIEIIEQRAAQLDDMGCDYICVPVSIDASNRFQLPLQALGQINRSWNYSKLAVTGDINPVSITYITPYHPDVIVVGDYITANDNQRMAVRKINKRMASDG
ncbi:MAG: orotidine 5'-phosphate decarboxylase / HUMPS family protein [Chloroflexota bacterium]